MAKISWTGMSWKGIKAIQIAKIPWKGMARKEKISQEGFSWMHSGEKLPKRERGARPIYVRFLQDGRERKEARC